MNLDTRDPRTYAIIGSAMEVHKELGHGFLEGVYQEALAMEFADRGIPFVAQPELTVWYKNRALTCTFRADFICYETVVVELKALAALGGVEQAQVINYLKATRIELGLLLNFGAPKLDFERLILTPR